MKEHPQVFMDLLNEHHKKEKFPNEAYRDSSVRMSQKMKFNFSNNERALSVPKNSIPVEDYGGTLIKPNQPNASFKKESN